MASQLAPYTDRIKQRNEYVAQLVAALTDIHAENYLSGEIRTDGGIAIRVDLAERPDQVVGPVQISHSYRRRGSRSIFKNTDVKHIAKNARRIVAEHLEFERTRDAYLKSETAREERETEAGKAVTASVTYVNKLAVLAKLGLSRDAEIPVNAPGSGYRQVSDLTIEEYTGPVTGDKSYRFDFTLNSLTEAQALAVLAALGVQ